MTKERREYFSKMTNEELQALVYQDFLIEEIIEFRDNTPFSPEERNYVDLLFIQSLKINDFCKKTCVSRSTAYRIKNKLSKRMKNTLSRMLYTL